MADELSLDQQKALALAGARQRASEGVTPPAADRTPEPSTTASGLAASAGRGLAGPAAAAALGGAAGSVIPGVGTAVGAGAGFGAYTLEELTSAVYNPIAKAMGWPELPSGQALTDKALDKLGVKKPTTAAERMTETAASGAASGFGGAKTAELVASKAAGPVTKKVAEQLAKNPGLQTASGAASGGAAQGAAEAGAGPKGQTAAALAAGVLPFGKAGLKAVAGSEPTAPAALARQHGYVLPPQMASDQPSILSKLVGGWSGKIKTQQGASARNQDVTNRLAVEALGLPTGTTLSPSVFRKLRADAGKAYQDVKTAVPDIAPDQAFQTDVANLGGANSQAAKFFPNIVKNPAIDEMIDELKNVPAFSTEAGVEVVKELRHSANGNLKAIGDPSKHALGLAQRQAADAMDELIDRNISASGQQGVVDRYRDARKLIAKSYDVEGATNVSTGDVSAGGLAKLGANGRPLTDQLKVISDVANAFPKAMQGTAAFGGAEDLSALDFFGSAAAMMHGNPGVAAAILGRPVARGALLSQPFQDWMTTPSGLGAPPLSTFAVPGASSAITQQAPQK